MDFRYGGTSAMMFFVFAVSVLSSLANKVSAAASCELKIARIVSIQGTVELRRVSQTNWLPAAMDMSVCPGDMLRVRSRSRAALRLNNESILRVDQRTTITFPAQDDSATMLLDLFNGALHIFTRTPRPFKIRTPFVNATVDGTEFFVSVDQDSTQLVIFEGQVSVSNEQGSLILTGHEASITHKNEMPKKMGVISSTDAVQWALYYPTIIDYKLNEKLSAEPTWPKLQASITLYQQGRFFEALAKLDEVPQSARAVHFLTYYAGLLLSVGRVDEAQTAIEQALESDPDDSNAYALKAIIAVVQNDKEQALNLATKAVELDQSSATTKLALSYAQQALFEMDDALANVQEAVKINTQNALVWARLSELQMSTGQLDNALESALQAVNLNSALAKTQTVLGFAYLLQIDIETAKAIFTKAIELDQTDPMPRLGMGLALIREGELEAGRIELEIAVSLDPANSLIRSYLGKAYFEEKRYRLASTQFDIAKERDPYDPTPWFYDAIQKQTQNRPIEALQDIQKSIELNDNRAVYRSKLLLDQDQAGRGSSLARIYENLGFEKRALVETAKSLSFDPSNHSAHRFLSDAYTNIPRHEIARVSELLQAQLLQPINVNPVQPRLAVADLNIITNTGPAVTGFNEFTPLMERNRPQLVASGVVGGDSTFGNESVLSALYDRASISIGQYHFQSDGFRGNNDQKHNIYNAFLQYAITPKFNVQAEVRTRKTMHGDLLLDFDPDVFQPKDRRKLNEETARVGARYALSPNQDFIFSGVYIDRNEKNENFISTFNPFTGLNFESTVTDVNSDKGFLGEFQHLFRQKYFNSTAGGSIYQFDDKSRSNCEGDCGLDATRTPAVDRFKREWEHAYLYTNINYFRNTSTTFGLSYDSYRQSNNDLNFNKVNPKFGLQWNIFDFLRLRLAWFKTSKPALIANQTLEPTQVAGFNQFFDDLNGTRARRRGIGLDGNFSKFLYGGIEASERKLRVPLGIDRQNQTEQLYHAYFYWLPHSYWTVRGEFQFEKFTRNAKTVIKKEDPHRIQTLRAPLSINYFNPSGFFSTFTTTFVRQSLDRQEETNVDAFFLHDSIIGYRLPKRMGIITLEGRNLLNEKFNYRNVNFYVSESVNPRFIPSRTFLARLTLNF